MEGSAAMRRKREAPPLPTTVEPGDMQYRAQNGLQHVRDEQANDDNHQHDQQSRQKLGKHAHKIGVGLAESLDKLLPSWLHLNVSLSIFRLSMVLAFEFLAERLRLRFHHFTEALAYSSRRNRAGRDTAAPRPARDGRD